MNLEAIGCSGVVSEGVVFMRMGSELTRPVVDATRKLQLAALAERPSGIGIVLLLDGLPALPNGDVRGYAAKMASQHSDGILAHATVIRGEGFGISAVRSALTGIFMVAKSPYPRTVVGDVDAAVDFIRKHLKGTAPAKAALLRVAAGVPLPSG